MTLSATTTTVAGRSSGRTTCQIRWKVRRALDLADFEQVARNGGQAGEKDHHGEARLLPRPGDDDGVERRAGLGQPGEVAASCPVTAPISVFSSPQSGW